MSRIKLLLDVVEDMRSLADSLQAAAEAIAQGDAGTPAEPAPPPVVKADPVPEVSLEEVRAFLGQKSRDGYTDAVRGLLQQFSATRLSEVDPKDYAALMKAAEELTYGT